MVCTFYHVTDVSYQEKYNKRMFMHHLLVSPLPHTGKTVQLPQSDLTPWTLTLPDDHSIIQAVTKGIGEERRTRKLKINKIHPNLADVCISDLLFHVKTKGIYVLE